MLVIHHNESDQGNLTNIDNSLHMHPVRQMEGQDTQKHNLCMSV